MYSAWQFTPATDGKRLVAYGDLNCPFCYALEERLVRREADVHIEWRLVEHAPSLPATLDACTTDDQAELDQELEALRTRAPDVSISRPPFRPQSGPAIRAVLAVQAIEAAAADRFRLALYRGLWRQGRNIADAAVIADIAAACGVYEPLNGAPYRAAAEAWTAEWRASRVDRIPCLVSSADAKLLGLSSVERLELFLESGLFGSQTDDACTTPSP